MPTIRVTCAEGRLSEVLDRIGNGDGNYAHQRQVSDSSQRHVVRCKEKAIDERSEVAAQRESERESCFWFLQLALQGFGDWSWLMARMEHHGRASWFARRHASTPAGSSRVHQRIGIVYSARHPLAWSLA
jgi:hypothetical protein